MEKQAHPMPLLSPRAAAKLLNLPTQTIRDMIKRKELLAFRVGNRNLFETVCHQATPHPSPLTFSLQASSSGSRTSRWSPFPLAGRIAVSPHLGSRREALGREWGVDSLTHGFTLPCHRIQSVKSRLHTENRPTRIFPKTVRLLFTAWFRT